MRARGKLPAQITEFLAKQFNHKVLPPYLRMRFDFRDDEEDQQRALISDIRGRRRERDIGSGTLTVRAARVIMLSDGDIDREIFEELELNAGRLEDGTPISALFFDPEYALWLNLGLGNPLDFGSIDLDVAEGAVARARMGIYTAMRNTRARGLMTILRQSLGALDWYEEELRKRKAAQSFEQPTPAEQVTRPPEDEEDEEEVEGSGRSSMGNTRRSAMQKAGANGWH
jgi:hypothetical protein